MSTSSAPTVDFASGDHYAVLGIRRDASEAEIARAYKSLALRYHPDKNQGNKVQAEISFKRIAEAYAVLRDTRKRSEYDRSGATRSYVSYDEAEQMWRQFGSGEEAPALHHELDVRRKAMGLFLVIGSLVLAPRLLTQLLPGLTVAVIGLAWLSRRGNSSKWVWCTLGLLVAGYTAPWILRARSSMEARPLPGVMPPPADAYAKNSRVPVGIPHSGEEVLMNDGRFVRLADPLKRDLGERTADEGWQQRFMTEMTATIQKGQEQVLMVFSRQGCPWCDKQRPVLQRAIKRRSTGHSPEIKDAEVSVAFLQTASAAVGVSPGSAAPSLLNARLRVFIFDAGEFPQVAQTFKVEAFPTTIAWGSPGVTPMAAKGYLDDQSLDELLRTMAAGVPDQADN